MDMNDQLSEMDKATGLIAKHLDGWASSRLERTGDNFLARYVILWGTDEKLNVGKVEDWKLKILAAWEKYGTGRPLDPRTVQRLAEEFSKPIPRYPPPVPFP